ncbi:MAG: hypothetical protein AAB439_00890 [Patescibacteria group bacterium]
MEKKSALERLAKKLNSRTDGEFHARRSTLSAESTTPARSWQSEKPVTALETGGRKKMKRLSYLELFFIGSVVFFVIAGASAAFLFFSGSNTVSTRNVDIAISGPTSVRAGEVLPLQIVLTNRNSVPMELTDLVVEFPPGTRSENDVTLELPRIRESLGTIKPGESVNRTVRAIMFGQADQNLDITVSVEYRVPSSNAIFLAEETYSLPISQSPASITVESLQEIVSGQETALTVTVTSNVTEVLDNLLLVAEYPPGFSFKSASPTAVTGSNTWRLGDIEAGGKRTITIRGVFTGEDGDERVVHFTTGTENGNAKDEIAAPLATGDVALKLAKPFVSLSLSLDGSVATEKVVVRGAPVRVDLRWVNNLPQRAQDVELEVKLNGAILDRNSIVAQKGFWRSSDNTVIFSRETDSALNDVAPGGTGTYSFSFASLPFESGVFKNPEITLSATVRARRITESNVPETIESKTTSRVLVATDLSLANSLSYLSGSKPPKADTDTTYLVSWTVNNTANAVANAQVTAALPSYVKFVQGSTNDAISYNSIGGVVTWTVGDLEAGQSKNATFQVTLTPSLSQVGNMPTVISDQRVYGFDRFTRTNIERSAQALTTQSAGATPQLSSVVP